MKNLVIGTLGVLFLAAIVTIGIRETQFQNTKEALNAEKISRAIDRVLATQALSLYRYFDDFEAFDDPAWFAKIIQDGNIEVLLSSSNEVAVVRYPLLEAQRDFYAEGTTNVMQVSMKPSDWFSLYQHANRRVDEPLSFFTD